MTLRNAYFRERVIWAKQLGASKSGKRIYRRTAPEKWVVQEIPEQRIPFVLLREGLPS